MAVPLVVLEFADVFRAVGVREGALAVELVVLEFADVFRGGFQLLPDILLKKQVELGLSPIDLLVLINITMHWWYPDQRPFPRTSTIAERMGVDTRTVQRSLRKLSDLKLVERVQETIADGTTRTVSDLSGLISQLEKFVVNDLNYGVRENIRQSKAADAAALFGVTPAQ